MLQYVGMRESRYFSLDHHTFLFSSSLWKTARYRLKYYPKEPLNTKQPIILYCEILNFCGINFLRFNKNDILAHLNFGVHDIRWLKIP